MNIRKHIDLLGLKVQDRVTGFSGVVSSVCFDLYGCVQAAVTPSTTKEGKLADGSWFDVNRLKVLSIKPVMQMPNFDYGPQAEGRQGAADKPRMVKP